MPADLTPDPTHEPHATTGRTPAGDMDQAPAAPSTGPSIAPSTATSPAGRVRAGQPRRSRARNAFDNPPKSTQVWKPTGVRRQEVLRALGIFQRATADQLWRMLRPTDQHDRITRDTLNALKDSGLVRMETRLSSGHQLWVLTEKGHKEARLLLPKHIRISALRKLEYDHDGRPKEADGYDEHAAAVTSTAAVLTGAGFGTPLSWQTEIGHKLPYGYTQYADLTMRAPDAGVPAMLLEVDRVTEPVDDLVAKLRRYTEWFQLPAPKADPKREPAARLWSRLYPATGHEGYVPVAFMFTGKTAAQRESRMRRLEQAGRPYFAGTKYPGADITAVNYHQAVPVVVTELERITADPKGAGGVVWRRLGRSNWQNLTDALDNVDGDRLHEVERQESWRRQREQAAAEREAQRPVCPRCGAKFTDKRWHYVRSYPTMDHRELCDPCLTAHFERDAAERAAQRQAEEAARAAAEAGTKKNRGVFGIGRRR